MITNDLMSYFYTPYSGDKPATIWVNGHRVIIVSERRESFARSLDLLGADSVKRIPGGNTAKDHRRFFSELSKSADGGIVVTTDELSVADVIKGLETELPWIH